MSAYFIKHPVIATVIAVLTTMLGVVCMMNLPVEQYPEMKANKVEIIFISVDDSPEEAKAYIEHYNAGFPGLYVRTKEVRNLPSLIIPRGIPTATILDANGKVLFNGHAAKALNWKELCKPAAK